MRKLINPVPAGGAPLFGDTVFGPIIQDIYSALEGVLANIQSETQGVIVSGCVVTGSGPYNCTSGIVYLNGKFMSFQGFTGQTFTKYIVPASATNTAKTFFDGVSRNILTTEDATLSSSTPGSGQYITISSTTPRSLSNYVSPLVVGKAGGPTNAMQNYLDMGAQQIQNMAAPTVPSDAANKFYVDTNDTAILTQLGNITIVTYKSSAFDFDTNSSFLSSAISGLTMSKVISLSVLIENNLGTVKLPFSYVLPGTSGVQVSLINSSGIKVQVSRDTGSIIDSASYNAAIVHAVIMMEP